jgi:hypothetical protein
MKPNTTASTIASPPPADSTPTPADGATAIYEVTCHEVEIDHLICYRTHRLALSQAQADAINTIQPGSLRFVGI